MFLIPVNSSAIRAVGYNPLTRMLSVLFHTSDTVYDHPGVPASVYLALMAAASIGVYYAKHIRGKYK